MSDREELLRETQRMTDERMRIVAAKVRAKLGPGPRERETGVDPFAEGAELPAVPVSPARPL